MKQFFFLLLIVLSSCVPPVATTSDIRLVYEDMNYFPNVGTVMLHPIPITTGFANPIISLESDLMIRFDLLEEDFRYMNLKVFHCDHDWSPSALQPLEYLDDYNEFPINDYEFSKNTYIPYVQYRLMVPRVKLSGNYLLLVSDNRGQPILSRRLMVFEQKMDINAAVTRSTGINERNSHQQIEFDVNYSRLNISDPRLDLFPVILQNHNWKLAIRGLQPTSIRVDQNYLEYKHFSQENTIPGWNEFRFFDTRSLSYRGQQIEALVLREDLPNAILKLQSSRGSQAYSEPFEEDLDGNFILENRDPLEDDLQSEYVNVVMRLQSDKINGKIHAVGKFNNWSLDASNQLTFNENLGFYQGNILVKQGFYNYMFFIKEDPGLTYYGLEGSHFQTENEYEILMYFREQGKVFDRLVGYERFTSN